MMLGTTNIKTVSSASCLSLLICYAAFGSQVRIPLGEEMFTHVCNEACKCNPRLRGITQLLNLLLKVCYWKSKIKTMKRMLFGLSQNNVTLKKVIRLKVNINGIRNYRNQKIPNNQAVTDVKN